MLEIIRIVIKIKQEKNLIKKKIKHILSDEKDLKKWHYEKLFIILI